ncbi:DUF2528 family protein [Rheinheimera baltica]|uniref:DUF2528 family protein n=1 Tax=Rheinheimera baltica TaxID=67576 RepID=UPI0003FC7CA4|nr:DUF2528 family protein [Rheinheimera baltica]
MSNIKTYKVKDDWKDYEVTLEVDHEILTPELAREINQFWCFSDDRIDQENGSHVRVVIRLAGLYFINAMLSHDGVHFGKSNTEAGAAWSRDLTQEEGWPEKPGIRVIAASVEAPDYDSLELTELTI